jgi:hypothetical protein
MKTNERNMFLHTSALSIYNKFTPIEGRTMERITERTDNSILYLRNGYERSLTILENFEDTG